MTTHQVLRPTLITLTGLSRTGKDSVIEAIQSSVEEGAVARVGLADEVKQFAHDFYGLPADLGWWENHKDRPLMDVGEYAAIVFHLEKHGHPATARGLLILIGSQMRKRQPDWWLFEGMRKVARSFHDGARIVIVPDARFYNEVTTFKGGGRCLAWRLHRPGAVPIGEADLEVDQMDTSVFSAEIHNDGTLAQLQDRVLYELESVGVLVPTASP